MKMKTRIKTIGIFVGIYLAVQAVMISLLSHFLPPETLIRSGFQLNIMEKARQTLEESRKEQR